MELGFVSVILIVNSHVWEFYTCHQCFIDMGGFFGSRSSECWNWRDPVAPISCCHSCWFAVVVFYFS
jgi:hypothetical protein